MYTAKIIEKIDNGKGFWNFVVVGIFDEFGKQIGQYQRNYGSAGPFFPFKQDGEWFALYSKDYTATRVMRLPSCEDIGGEEHDSHGFCPVEYYVPMIDESTDDFDTDADDLGEIAGTFGFVSGCHWGDDSSMKIQYLDLSKVKEGILTRDERFGYIEQPGSLDLKKCFSFRFFDENGDTSFKIMQSVPFHLDGRNAELQGRLQQEARDKMWEQAKKDRQEVETLTGLKVDGFTGVGLRPIVKKDGVEYAVTISDSGEAVLTKRF
jgi:hypothetical protein